MADVKWIKMSTSIFDNRKIRQIECLPEGNAIIVTWLKLLCLAGNVNDNGLVYFTKELPYTEQMLSTQFNMPISTVQLALKTFEKFEMVEVVDDILHISNWEKYQNIEGMERIREQTKQRVARHREKQKMLQDNECNVTVTLCNAIEEDKEEERRIKEIKEKIDYQQIADLFNQLCPSFPSIKSLSDARKKAIKARLTTYTIDDFKTLFMKAEASAFLKGANDRNWTATFDWLIKDSNMAKVLDGNYDNRTGASGKGKNNAFNNFHQRQIDFDELEKMLIANNDEGGA